MLKQLLILSCLVVSPLHDGIVANKTSAQIYVENINLHYKVDAKKIVSKVQQQTDNSFPRTSDVLAIIAIESNFKEKAVSQAGAKGLMQILYRKTSSTKDNISAGIWLLREYKRRLKSERAAIHAYNIGIGNYLKGKRNQKYHKKYLEAKMKIQENYS